MVNRLIFVLIALVVAVSAHSLTREEQIAERLKPVGASCMAGEACAASSAVSASAVPEGPDAIYDAFCVACHATGVGEAPIYGDVAAWQPRIEKGMDVLYTSGIEGLGVLMPAMGTCMSCSEDDIRAVVDYMVENSQ